MEFSQRYPIVGLTPVEKNEWPGEKRSSNIGDSGEDQTCLPPQGFLSPDQEMTFEKGLQQ